MNTLKDEKIIERILNKAVEDTVPNKEGLKDMLLSGKKLNVYYGIDPTAPTLHIGHSVMMRKLEDFRKLGHKTYLLLGDFTGRIGDPSDKTATRSKLTKEIVQENLKEYKKQASRFLNFEDKDNPVEVVFNGDWHDKLTFEQVIELASEFTVQQMLKRNMFQKRIEEDKPIGLHEFLYPLMQGYDSVVLEADVELGGNDQLFNMLAGRDMVRNHLKKEKYVVTGKLLTTPDGVKMGKSEGNMIMLSDTPENIFGKVMAFPDEHIIGGFELLTDSDMEDVKSTEERMNSGENPMILKKELAFKLTSDLFGEEIAKKAQLHFETSFQTKTYEEVSRTVQGNRNILDLLVEEGIAKSKSEARRLVDQGAVKLNDITVDDWGFEVIETGILKVGKVLVRVE